MTAGGQDFDRASTGVERRGLMFVLSSPSGAGKTTLSRMLLKRMPGLQMSVSATTRPMRPGESRRPRLSVRRQGRDSNDGEAANCSNGPPCSTIATARRARRSKRRWRAGRDVLFDIDWQGTQQLREKAGSDVVSVFILPPSAADLEKRLHTRAQDSDEVIRGRMDRAGHEISHWAEYDYIVINHDLDEAFDEVQSILKAERLKRERQVGLSEFVRELQRQLEK